MENSIKHKLFKIDQNIVLKNDNDEILVLEKDGKWMLPGGRLDKDELLEEGLRREVEEETGIKDFVIEKVSSVDMSDSGDTYISVSVGRIEGKPEVKLSNEHQNYAWIKPESLDDYSFWHEKIKERIKKALYE